MEIAIISVAGAVLLVIVLVSFVRRRLRSTLDSVLLEYPEHVRIITSPMANFFGLASRGMGQVRGNGVLILTSSSLYFRMLLPSRELEIPIAAISGVRTPKSFLGKTKGRKLLQVDFRGTSGEGDSAAWLVGDLDRWVTEIEKLLTSS